MWQQVWHNPACTRGTTLTVVQPRAQAMVLNSHFMMMQICDDSYGKRAEHFVSKHVWPLKLLMCSCAGHAIIVV